MHESLDWDGQLAPILEQFTAEHHATLCGCQGTSEAECPDYPKAREHAVARIEAFAHIPPPPFEWPPMPEE